MEMNDERGKNPEADAEKSPGKRKQSIRWNAVVKLGVEREQTAAAKQRQCETKKKEYTLEVTLAAMAEDHNHPEERQESASSQSDQAGVREPVHEEMARVYRRSKGHGNGQVQGKSCGTILLIMNSLP